MLNKYMPYADFGVILGSRIKLFDLVLATFAVADKTCLQNVLLVTLVADTRVAAKTVFRDSWASMDELAYNKLVIKRNPLREKIGNNN